METNATLVTRIVCVNILQQKVQNITFVSNKNLF